MSSRSTTGVSTVSMLPTTLEDGDLQSTRKVVERSRTSQADVPADRSTGVECLTVVLVSVAYLFIIQWATIVWYVVNAELLLGTLATFEPLLCLLIAVNVKQLRVACVHTLLATLFGIATFSHALYEAIPLIEVVDALVRKGQSSVTCIRFPVPLVFESSIIAMVVMVALLKLYRIDSYRDRNMEADTSRPKKRGRNRRRAKKRAHRLEDASVIPETKFI